MIHMLNYDSRVKFLWFSSLVVYMLQSNMSIGPIARDFGVEEATRTFKEKKGS